jgi:hypothetical protein
MQLPEELSAHDAYTSAHAGVCCRDQALGPRSGFRRTNCAKEESAMKISCLRVVVALLSGLVTMSTLAEGPTRLEVIVFAGGFNWPIWVAQEKGFFRENDIAVNVTPTPGSVYQLDRP